jgi:hypothetical protein
MIMSSFVDLCLFLVHAPLFVYVYIDIIHVDARDWENLIPDGTKEN